MEASEAKPPLSGLQISPRAPSLERRRLRVIICLMLGDIICVLAAFFVAGGLYENQWPSSNAMLAAQLLLPLLLTVGIYSRSYSVKALTDLPFALKQAFLALLISALLLIFITFYAKISDAFSRGAFTFGMIFTAVGFAAIRCILSAIIETRWSGIVSNVLVIKAGGPELEISNAYIVDAAYCELMPDPADPHSLDRLGHYLLNMDRVIVTCPPAQRPRWSSAMRAAGVRGEVVSNSLSDIQPIGLVADARFVSLIVSDGPLGLRSRAYKRIFDLVFSVCFLCILWPIMLTAAIAIKISDGGPVYFVQRRLGRGNRFFDLIKFRSMSDVACDASGYRSATRDDDRVTRVGRFLRRTSIDELPQIFNILRGDMSVVGPRPHALGSQAGEKLFWEVDGKYWDRHALKPGLTGLAQIRGLRGATDNEADLKGRLAADLEYIRNWSILGDLAILFGTIRVVVHKRAF